MVALSESVMKICVLRPLAEDCWWRQIRLAIKPRYLGNYASQIKSDYGTLSGSHSRSFRIHHGKLHEAHPGGEIMMTSYWLTIKPRYLGNYASQIKSCYGTLSGSHGHSFRILHEKVRFVPPGKGLTMTTYPVGNKTSLSRKPYMADNNVTIYQ